MMSKPDINIGKREPTNDTKVKGCEWRNKF